MQTFMFSCPCHNLSRPVSKDKLCQEPFRQICLAELPHFASSCPVHRGRPRDALNVFHKRVLDMEVSAVSARVCADQKPVPLHVRAPPG